MTDQLSLFAAAPAQPEGFRLIPELIGPDAEQALIARFADLPFKPFEFQGYLGKRRVVSFGWRYDFNERTLSEAAGLPDFLAALREPAAAFAGLPADALRQVLATEYAPGAGIGWHRDRPEFDQVVGVSLGAPCVLRFRRREGGGWARISVPLPPRSAYLLSGPARSDWEHSIPPVEALRYSVTFRSLRSA